VELKIEYLWMYIILIHSENLLLWIRSEMIGSAIDHSRSRLSVNPDKGLIKPIN